MTALPTVRVERLEHWARLHGLPTTRDDDRLVLALPHHGGSREVVLWVSPDGAGLAARTVLSVEATDERAGAVRAAAARLLSHEPAPVLTILPSGPDDLAEPEGPRPGLDVVLDAATPVEEGMSDAQLDEWLQWATGLLGSSAALLEDSLHPAEPHEEA
ncbi:hypothetical protein [Actinomyces radicidentis]|uniref:hypothetical protein n=1 Tax=Actinomyces radicidentis TaxID=111015 RepID=UPI0026DF2621|nr:hypothetical protein [Actinomyces radicidentis]